jgi:hypothetical protein
MQKVKAVYLLLLLTILISACNSDQKKLIVQKEKRLHKVSVSDTSKILLSNTYLHAFSDEVKKDTFKLILTGTSILQGKLTFRIINFENKEIYTDKFNAIDLLTDLEDVTPTKQQKLDTFKTRFNHFFDHAFPVPAINPRQPLDSDYVDIKIQRDIQSDTSAIGFVYAYGYEGVYEIAWSKRKKRVVLCAASD